jgi:hypothetical protein
LTSYRKLEIFHGRRLTDNLLALNFLGTLINVISQGSNYLVLGENAVLPVHVVRMEFDLFAFLIS